jgi:hypothetical protein
VRLKVTIKESLINAIATAVLLGAGSTVLGVKINDAHQDERITRLEDLDASVDGLRVDLKRVDGKLERIEGRMDGEREPRQ